MTEEIWKVIERFPEYEISNTGNIRSKNNNKSMFQPYKAPYGVMVNLKLSNGARKTVGLKALMKQAFGISLPLKPKIKEVPRIKQEVPRIRDEKPKDKPAPKIILDETSCEAWL